MITNFLSILFLFLPILFIYSRFNFIINYFFIIILFLIVFFNRQNNDYLGYQEIFQNSNNYSDFGYSFLIDILKFFGATDHVSVIICLSILIFITFLRLSIICNYCYALVILYFIFLLGIDLNQIRYTFAIFFIINSILDLSKKRYILSFSYLLFAFSFHYFSILLIFLIFISFYDLNSNNVYKKAFFGFIFVLLTINILIEFFIQSGFEIRTLNSYFTDFKLHSLIVWGLTTLLFIFIINYFKTKSDINLFKINYLFILIMNISIYSLMLSPGLLYILEFNRLYRGVLMLLNIAGIILIGYLSLKNKIYLFLFLFLINLFLGFYYSFQINFDYTYWGIK